jgi:hypothetical protein
MPASKGGANVPALACSKLISSLATFVSPTFTGIITAPVNDSCRVTSDIAPSTIALPSGGGTALGLGLAVPYTLDGHCRNVTDALHWRQRFANPDRSHERIGRDQDKQYNAATEATVALSASGVVSVLTSPTLAAQAFVFLSSSSGTLLAPATAGTFAITMKGTGAGFCGRSQGRSHLLVLLMSKTIG